jgi:hypothetical protein
MSDDKSKSESQFNLDAIKESIERMKPELSPNHALTLCTPLGIDHTSAAGRRWKRPPQNAR